MKKKVLLLIAMCTMLAYMLCGCGEKVDAETLMTDSVAHLKEATSMENEVELNCEFTLSSTEGEIDSLTIGFGGEFNASSIRDEDGNSISYLKSTSTTKFGDDVQEDVTEQYNVTEGDTKTIYECDTDGYWTKTESEAEGFSDLADVDFTDFYSSFVLAEETQTCRGYECYVLTASLSSDELSAVAEQAEEKSEGDMQDTLDTLTGFTGDIPFTVDVTYYVDKKTHNPVDLKLSLGDIDNDALSEAVAKIFGEGIGFSVDEFSFSISFDNINKVGDIEVPQEVIEAAESGEYELSDDCIDSFEDGGDTKEESDVDTEAPSKDYSSGDDKH